MMTYHQREFVSSNNSHHREAAAAPLKSYMNHQPKQYYQPQPQQSLQLNHEEAAFSRTLCDWIAEDSVESLTLPSAQHYLRLIKDIMVLINPHSLRDNLLLSTVFYADRFVKRRGVKLEEPRKAFLVLLISALVTIKMWEDFEVKTETLERYTGISKKQITVLERQFLGVLEYSLFCSYEEMVSWQIQCCFPQAPTA